MSTARWQSCVLGKHCRQFLTIDLELMLYKTKTRPSLSWFWFFLNFHILLLSVLIWIIKSFDLGIDFWRSTINSSVFCIVHVHKHIVCILVSDDNLRIELVTKLQSLIGTCSFFLLKDHLFNLDPRQFFIVPLFVWVLIISQKFLFLFVDRVSLFFVQTINKTHEFGCKMTGSGTERDVLSSGGRFFFISWSWILLVIANFLFPLTKSLFLLINKNDNLKWQNYKL